MKYLLATLHAVGVWLRAQWELKLLALVLAITLYFYTANQVRGEVELTVEPQLLDKPDDRDITGFQPPRFRIVVDGPAGLLPNPDQVLRPGIPFRAERVQAGGLNYEIDAELLGLDPHLRLRSATTPNVQLSVDLRQRRLVTLQFGIDNLVLATPGLMRVAAQAGISQIQIEGPERILAQIPERVAVKPVDITALFSKDLTAPEERTIIMDPDLGLVPEDAARVRILGQQQQLLTATVTVAPQPGELVLNLPLHLLATREFHEAYEVEMAESTRPLRLMAPVNLHAGLAELVTAYVRLPSKPDLDLHKDYPVRVVAPAYVTIPQDAPQVDIRIRRRAKPATVGVPGPGVEPTVP